MLVGLSEKIDSPNKANPPLGREFLQKFQQASQPANFGQKENLKNPTNTSKTLRELFRFLAVWTGIARVFFSSYSLRIRTHENIERINVNIVISFITFP